jgi:PPOX class probable F420-dependent enzyme
MSRREQIRMTEDELAAFLVEQRVMICATNGVGGWPHLMPLWYVVREGELWAWTYAKSQKVRNLERDPRATLQVEAGERYEELRGVMIEARAGLHRDTALVAELGAEIYARYTGHSNVDEMIRVQAPKRVALQFVPSRIATWDHRKLRGMY